MYSTRTTIPRAPDTPTSEVCEEVRVGVRVGPVEFKLYGIPYGMAGSGVKTATHIAVPYRAVPDPVWKKLYTVTVVAVFLFQRSRLNETADQQATDSSSSWNVVDLAFTCMQRTWSFGVHREQVSRLSLYIPRQTSAAATSGFNPSAAVLIYKLSTGGGLTVYTVLHVNSDERLRCRRPMIIFGIKSVPHHSSTTDARRSAFACSMYPQWVQLTIDHCISLR